jgi:uncharacterized protein (TIGR03437 family)
MARLAWGAAMLSAFAADVWPARAAEISLPAEVAAPGSSVFLPVTFRPQSAFVSGLQFDFEYDGSAMSVVAIVDMAARNGGKSLFQADLSPGKKRFLIAGLNANPIPEGVIVGLLANLKPDSPNGSSLVTLSGAMASNERGEPLPLGARGGSITIQGAATQPVRLQPAGVLNAASLVAGPVSPGEIITLIGSGIGPAREVIADPPGPTSLAETSLHFDGVPAPLLYAGPNQVNAIVPYAVQGKVSVQLSVFRSSVAIASLPLPVVSATPAIFTIGSQGVGQTAALNQDGTSNSDANPAERGSIAVIFATGAGQTNPAGVDGLVASESLPKPVLPVAVTVAGRNADVLYAGAAPALVAGVVQLNLRIPDTAPAGPAIPIGFSIGSATSPVGTTLAVK